MSLPGRLCLTLAAALVLLPVSAGSVPLRSIHYPEKQMIEMNFAVTSIAPPAVLTTEVLYRQGQAPIEVAFEVM